MAFLNKETSPEEGAEYVASATECTGLVPALTDEAGEESRREMYAVRPAKRPGRMYRKR